MRSTASFPRLHFPSSGKCILSLGTAVLLGLGVAGCNTDPPITSLQGVIEISSSTTEGNVALVLFARPPASVTDCQQLGDCRRCTAVDSGPDVPAAGTISVTRAGAPLFTMAPGVGGYSNPVFTDSSLTSDSALWKGGEAIEVSAPGSEVPAFKSVGLKAPHAVVISLPALEPHDRGPTTIAQSRDLVFAWSGGVAGDRFNGHVSDAKNHYVNCTADAARGMLTIPAAALAGLETGSGVISAVTIQQREVQVGSYRIEVQLDQNATQAGVPGNWSGELAIE